MTDLPSPAATAARAILASIVRHGIAAAGSAIVARGYADQGTVSGAEPAIVDYAVGVIVVLGSGAWGALRARASHWRWVQALHAPALPRSPAGSDPARP